MLMSKSVKILSFIVFELILYFSFLYIDIFDNKYFEMSSILKFIGIVGCFCYVLFLLENNNPQYTYLVRGALFFTVISDIFLLLTNESEKGVFTFCIVQGIYRYYLWSINKQEFKKEDKFTFLYLPNIMIGFLVLTIMYFLSMPLNILLGITIFYFVSIVINVIAAIKTAILIRDGSTVIFAVGMVLFLFCDINVGIFNIADFLIIDSSIFNGIYEFSTIGMWLFYLPAQVLLALSLSFKNNGEKSLEI